MKYLSRDGVATLAAMLYNQTSGDQTKRVKASVSIAIQLFEEADIQCDLRQPYKDLDPLSHDQTNTISQGTQEKF